MEDPRVWAALAPAAWGGTAGRGRSPRSRSLPTQDPYAVSTEEGDSVLPDEDAAGPAGNEGALVQSMAQLQSTLGWPSGILCR